MLMVLSKKVEKWVGKREMSELPAVSQDSTEYSPKVLKMQLSLMLHHYSMENG